MARRKRTSADLLFVGTRGHVRAVSKRTGRLAWDLSLPGTGYEVVTILVEDDVVYAGSRGHLFAIHAISGELLWQNGLKGLGYEPLTLATVSGSNHDQVLVQVRAKEAERARRR